MSEDHSNKPNELQDESIPEEFVDFDALSEREKSITGGSNEVVVSAEVLEDGYRYKLEPIGVELQFIQNKDGETIPGITHELLLHVMIHRLKVLNDKHPCRENSIAITKLQETLHWFYARQDRRTKEEVDRAIEASGGEVVNEVIGTDSIPVFNENNAGNG